MIHKTNEACLALAEFGCACALKDVPAISVPDQPRNSHRLTSGPAANGVHALHPCGFVLQPHRTGVCCMETDKRQMAKAEDVVRQAGFAVQADEEL